ncbi:hypothetical protein [uncultured Croceicoccus sp.]|uniref:hypothetical protein n=1 Tax=uncultured Croceicoccus sp. TaxID=1295329 RepID=UPI00344C7DFE
MNTMKMIALPMMGAAALSMGGCADNYAAEGAGIGGALGAGVAAVTGEDVITYAAVGALAGGLAGTFKDKNNDCNGFRDRNGNRYIDEDCRNDDRYRNYF